MMTVRKARAAQCGAVGLHKANESLSQARVRELVAQIDAIAAKIDAIAASEMAPLFRQLDIIYEAGGESIEFVPVSRAADDLRNHYYDIMAP